MHAVVRIENKCNGPHNESMFSLRAIVYRFFMVTTCVILMLAFNSFRGSFKYSVANTEIEIIKIR